MITDPKALRAIFPILILLIGIAGIAWSAPENLNDGAMQNSSGGWDLPNIGWCQQDPAILTRPECLALRFPYATSAACTGAGQGYAFTSVCNLPSATDQASCEAHPLGSPVWSTTAGKCALSLKGENRNLATCQNAGGTWQSDCTGAWVFPAASAFTPPLKTGTGPGDQCLRCHNTITEWNNTKIRWVQSFLKTGHKNMSRKVDTSVDPGHPYPWAGPDGTVYPSDSSGNPINWTNNTINIGGSNKNLYWIFGDWLAPLPRAIYADGSSGTTGAPLVSYNCARCHTTGWTSDATINTIKEPERSFPGVTWDGVTLGTTGKVNLATAITGDTNKYASWDHWGISCTRCHMSVVPSGSGYNSHHNDLTNFDAGSGGGYCSDPRFRNPTKTQCETGGGTCDKYWYTTSAECTANGGAWTPATYYAQCSDPAYATKAACQGAGQTWSESTCSLGSAYTSQVTCVDAGGVWTGFKARRGQQITSVCMDCHRQETGGYPYDSTNPATVLKVGFYSGHPVFISHPHGNQFLNSTHGRFTGTFSQIGTSLHTYTPNVAGTYNSYYLKKNSEANNVGNGCTGCHDVHESIVKETGHEGAIREECMHCHEKNLSSMMHPAGPGTPLEHMTTEPMEACVTCHMPQDIHLFRINKSAGYSTFPAPTITATTSGECSAAGGTWNSRYGCIMNANTADDDGYTGAVWVDVDLACGQCHGGGTNSQISTGDMTSGSKNVTVKSTTGFVAGNRVSVAGAGVGGATLETYIAKVVNGTTLTLATGASTTVKKKKVTQGPTKNMAAYLTKTQLANYAADIHNDKPFVSFGYTTSGLTVNVDASASTCSGSSANCDAYNWEWGDGTTGSGKIASHVYVTAGTKAITLTVHEYGVNENSTTKNVNVYATDAPPVVAGTSCEALWNANTWTATIVDSSTDDYGVAQVTVNWGDGSMLSVGSQGGTFTRTYIAVGTRTITHKAVDTIGQESTRTCVVSPAYFTISGTIYRSNGTTVVPSAKIQVKQNGSVVKTVYSASNGTFNATSLKPGTYTLTVTKSQHTFADPAATITVGPSSSGNNINALSP